MPAWARMSVRHSSGKPPVDPPQGDSQEPWIPEYIEKVHKRVVDQFNNCSLPPSKNNYSLLADRCQHRVASTLTNNLLKKNLICLSGMRLFQQMVAKMPTAEKLR